MLNVGAAELMRQGEVEKARWTVGRRTRRNEMVSCAGRLEQAGEGGERRVRAGGREVSARLEAEMALERLRQALVHCCLSRALQGWIDPRTEL